MSRRKASEYAGGNEEFATWLEEVDQIVQNKVGLSVFDLEDMMFFDSFRTGESAEEFINGVVIPTVRDNYGEKCAELLM